MPLLFTTIASGFNVSGDIDLRQLRLAGIQCRVLSSGDLAFRVSLDQTFAIFTRLVESSGDLRYPTAAGSESLAAPRQLESFPFARLETILGGVNSFQTDSRTFTLLAVPRS
jgi:hypothetical protein